MAEAFGVAASGISVASLTIQILENINRVINFCKSIREAPTDIQRILLELQLLSNIVSSMQLVFEKRSLPEISEAMTKKCLDLVRHDISKLSDLSLDLERKLNSEKRITRTWARVQTVLSEKKIAVLRDYLDSAKGTLQLLQCWNILDDVRALISLSSQTPKDLGYPWETGQVEEYVKIDDGLEKPFYLPIDLCSTPEGFISILTHKYKSKQLPGLSQIQRGHFRALNWSETTHINPDNWEPTVRESQGIKLAFIMSTWHGFPRGKCIRCYKPRGQDIAMRSYTKCFSCGLELRTVEPDAIPFEATDVSVGLFGHNQYRDYRLASSKKTNQSTPHSTSKPGTTPAPRRGMFYDDPPIDFVCKRLIVKWEPICNFVHRYLHCRCVIRLSTPSHIEKEKTLLAIALCPRHNSRGVSHLDYGDINYHEDEYFDQFGGYRSFQGMIYAFAPNIYDEILGGEKFLPSEQIEAALNALDAFREANEVGLRKVFLEYFYEVNDELERIGFPLPDLVVQAVKDERLRRRDARAARYEELGLPDFTHLSLSEEEKRGFRDIPMVRQVDEILDGKWSGKPHWIIED